MGQTKNNGRFMGKQTYTHTTDKGVRGYGHTDKQAKDESSRNSNKPFSWHPAN